MLLSPELFFGHVATTDFGRVHVFSLLVGYVDMDGWVFV